MGLLLAAGLALAVILGATGWFVFAPRPPSPTGPKAVGRSELTLKDSQGRSIAATAWYPAAGVQAGASPVENAPIEARTPAPVILYSPGWGNERRQSSIQAENLASHGFVVVGCDDYARDPAIDPDRGAGLDLSSDAAFAATQERAGRHVVTQAGRLVDVLLALEAGQSPLLAGRLDLTRVGVLGYSIGGASGLQAAAIDPRIVGVFSVDGGLFGPPAKEIAVPAYFLASSHEAFPSQADLASPDPFTRNYALTGAQDLPRNTRRMERPFSYWIELGRAGHADLSDELFVFSRNDMFRTNSERRAISSALGASEVAFFQSVLLGEQGPLLALRSQDNQNVRWISSTSAVPGATKARQ